MKFSGTHIQHPLRIQRKRTKGFRLPEVAVCVSRGTLFGNPFSTAAAFRRWLETGTVDRDSLLSVLSEEGLIEKRRLILNHLPSLAGRPLACWCPLGQPCHADVLAAMANTPTERISMPDDAELLAKANQLAREIYSVLGFSVPESFRFDKSDHPRASQVWQIVCLAYEHISATDLTDIDHDSHQ